MTVETNVRLTAGRAAAWRWLMDLAQPVACFPGARLDTSSDGPAVVIRAKLTSTAQMYRLTAQPIADLSTDFRRVFHVTVRAFDGSCGATATAQISLDPIGAESDPTGGSILRTSITQITPDPALGIPMDALDDLLRRLHDQFAGRADEAMLAATSEPASAAHAAPANTGATAPEDHSAEADRAAPTPAPAARQMAGASHRLARPITLAVAALIAVAAVVLRKSARRDHR